VAAGGECKHARGIRLAINQEVLPAGMPTHTSVFVVIEAGALKQLVVHRKTQRLDQMQLATRVGGQSDHVARVRRYLGVHQNDVEHVGFSR
jgi:hypothetical protein